MKYTPENTSKIGKPVDVYLNGVKHERVMRADTKQGFIEVCILDENGDIQPNADRTEVLTEIKYGFVEVVFKD